MKLNDQLYERPILAVLILMAMFVHGCVSVQVASRSSKPELLGFGWAKSIDCTSGQIYEIVAPGLSVRLHSHAPGLSLGWHELRLFYPSTDSQTESVGQPIAVQNKCVGINLTSSEIMIGFERTFEVALPPTQKDVVQFISYSAKNPTNTIVERKEAK